MRIVFHHRIASRDGQAVHIEELIAALQRQGHETILVGPPGFGRTGFGNSNPLIERLKRSTPAALYEVLELFYNLKAFTRLRRAVRQHQPDVIYERFSLFLLAGALVSRSTGTPMLLEVNSPLFEERAKNDGLRLHAVGRWAQRWIWRRAGHVLPVTAVLGRTVAEYGVPEGRITVIPNGINPDRFAGTPDIAAAKAMLGLPDRLVIGFAGFIRGWNAVDRMLDFVVQHAPRRDLHLLIVGDGPSRPELEARARQLGIDDRLTITGTIERDDMARHIAAFDIAVLPAVTPYSSPLKLFEYLFLGRAVVAPDDPNIREILTNNQNALLFSRDDPAALDAALLRLCDDPDLRRRLGRAAVDTITQRSLTWDHNATRVIDLAQQLKRAIA